MSDEPLRPGKQPHEGEAEHDEDKARDAFEKELVAEDTAPDERSADAEENEEGGESEDERHAPLHHPSRVPGLAELVCVDR